MPEQIVPITGLNTVGTIIDTPSVALPPNAFSDTQNVRLDSGSVRKMPGEIDLVTQATLDAFNSNAGVGDVVFVEWWPTPNLAPNDGYFVIVGRKTNSSIATNAEEDTVYLVKASDGTIRNTGFSTFVTADSKWQSTLFQGGFAFVINNGTSRPKYMIDPNGNTNIAMITAYDLPGWDDYLTNQTVIDEAFNEETFTRVFDFGRKVDFDQELVTLTITNGTTGAQRHQITYNDSDDFNNTVAVVSLDSQTDTHIVTVQDNVPEYTDYTFDVDNIRSLTGTSITPAANAVLSASIGGTTYTHTYTSASDTAATIIASFNVASTIATLTVDPDDSSVIRIQYADRRTAADNPAPLVTYLSGGVAQGTSQVSTEVTAAVENLFDRDNLNILIRSKATIEVHARVIKAWGDSLVAAGLREISKPQLTMIESSGGGAVNPPTDNSTFTPITNSYNYTAFTVRTPGIYSNANWSGNSTTPGSPNTQNRGTVIVNGNNSSFINGGTWHNNGYAVFQSTGIFTRTSGSNAVYSIAISQETINSTSSSIQRWIDPRDAHIGSYLRWWPDRTDRDRYLDMLITGLYTRVGNFWYFGVNPTVANARVTSSGWSTTATWNDAHESEFQIVSADDVSVDLVAHSTATAYSLYATTPLTSSWYLFTGNIGQTVINSSTWSNLANATYVQFPRTLEAMGSRIKVGDTIRFYPDGSDLTHYYQYTATNYPANTTLYRDRPDWTEAYGDQWTASGLRTNFYFVPLTNGQLVGTASPFPTNNATQARFEVIRGSHPAAEVTVTPSSSTGLSTGDVIQLVGGASDGRIVVCTVNADGTLELPSDVPTDFTSYNVVSTNSPVKNLPGVIKVSDVAAPGAIPLNWNPFAVGVNTAEEFQLGSSAVIQDVLDLQGTLMVYNDTSIYALTRTGNPNVPYVANTISTTFGAIGQGSVLEFNGVHLIVGSNDIYQFSGHPSSIQTIAADRIQNYFYENLSPTRHNDVVMILNRSQNEVWICYPKGTSETLNEVLVWSYKYNTWTIREMTPFNHVCIAPTKYRTGNDATLSTTLDPALLRPVMCTDNQVFGADFDGYFKTRDGNSYESYIERQQIALTPEFDVESLKSVALWTTQDGSDTDPVALSLRFRANDNPGESVNPAFTVTTDTMQNVPFTITEDYKADARLTGRFLSYRITDAGTTSDNGWNLSGIQYAISKGGRR